MGKVFLRGLELTYLTVFPSLSVIIFAHGTTQSIGQSYGETASRGSGVTAGSSIGQGISQSEGMSVGQGLSHSKNVGMNESVSESQTLGQTMGQSVSNSVTQGASSGYGQTVRHAKRIQRSELSTSNGQSKRTIQNYRNRFT